MKKKEIYASLLPEYGKRRLLLYADSFRELAKTFYYLPYHEENDEDRAAVLLQKRLIENRGLLADHLKEMAEIMTVVAEESFTFKSLESKEEKKLRHILKAHNIFLEEIYIVENKDHYMEITTKMRSNDTEGFHVEEIGNLISVICDKHLLPTKSTVTFLKEDIVTLVFREQSKFGVLTGVARVAKENEKVSGDNYAFIQMENGSMMCALSDGMGSGEKACKDSEAVVELLEKLVEAGFSKETAIQIINGALIASSEQQNMSTLDICQVNLYTGMCEILKVGTAASYLKRGSKVESIKATTLPLGVFQQVEIESVKRKIQNEDYIILVSDGVSDVINQENDSVLEKIIETITLVNPNEIAGYILRYAIRASKGEVRDDMTVLVIGIWEN